MANQSSTAFGFRPLRKVGQNDNNAGLSEWKKATGTAAINHHELTQLTADGVVLSSTTGTNNNIGSLNGSFYTAPTTLKHTWSNYAPNVVASDQVCLVNDDPQQMFEAMTSLTNYTAVSVGGCCPIVVGSGSGSPIYISGNSLGTVGTDDQIKILGLTRDTASQDFATAGSVWRVMVNQNMLGNNIAGI